MLSRRFATTIDAVRRVLPALGLAAALVISTLGLTGSVRADDQDPDARLQLVIKKITIHDDNDPGEGAISISVYVQETYTDDLGKCPYPAENPECRLGTLALAQIDFNASDDETVQLNRTVPAVGDIMPDPSVSSAFGIPVHAGHAYIVYIIGVERDGPDLINKDDDLGVLAAFINDQNGWGPLGTYTERAGDFSAEYEIRRTPLPDLHPKAIRVLDTVGSGEDVVCVEVENVGQTDAAPFHLSLYVDNSMPPNGTQEVAGLAPGESRETCIRTNLPTSGRHQLSAIVDQYLAVTETDERNNRLDKGLDRTPLGGTRPQDGPGVIGTDPDPGLGPRPAVIGTEPGSNSPGVSTDPGPTPTPTPTATPTATPGPARPKPSLR